MQAANHPFQTERLKALRDLDILDSDREREFDEIVELASRICETPISVVNLIDEHRQWFKAEVGLGVRETPLATSICAHVILEPDLTVIADTLKDVRMADNPLCRGEPHLRFYAGALLKTDDGWPIGTLCVLDHKPRDLNELQRFALRVLARQVMLQIKARKLVAQQATALQVADDEMERLHEAARAKDILMREVDHRVKNSLNIVAAMLNIQTKTAPSQETRTSLSTARDRVLAVAALHEQLHVASHYDRVDLPAFMIRLVESMEKSLPPNVTLRHRIDPVKLDTKMASSIGIIVNELVTNSLKHAFPGGKSGEICIEGKLSDGRLILDVWDTGVGFAETRDKGVSGLGMRIVRSSVEQFGGTLEQKNEARSGIGYRITLPVEA